MGDFEVWNVPFVYFALKSVLPNLGLPRPKEICTRLLLFKETSTSLPVKMLNTKKVSALFFPLV